MFSEEYAAINVRCKELNLMFDNSHQPQKVSAGMYLFYATPPTSRCVKYGYCKQERFYALTDNLENVIILKDGIEYIK